MSLFHGSAYQYTELVPQPHPSFPRPVVFAARSYPLAALCIARDLVTWELDVWYSPQEGDHPVLHVAERSLDAFESLRARSGWVHSVPAWGFRRDPRLGLCGLEFIRDAPCPVREATYIPNVYESVFLHPECADRVVAHAYGEMDV